MSGRIYRLSESQCEVFYCFSDKKNPPKGFENEFPFVDFDIFIKKLNFDDDQFTILIKDGDVMGKCLLNYKELKRIVDNLNFSMQHIEKKINEMKTAPEEEPRK